MIRPSILGLSWTVALTGCELVASLDARSVDPVLDGCTLPREGDARIRLANLRPGAEPVDFCVRTTGARYGHPVLRGGGNACAAGYRYEEVSAPFAARAGAIDVKMIPAGSACGAAALSELSNVALDTKAVVTIASLPGQSPGGQLLAFPEEPSPDGTHLRLRFLNAIADSSPLHLGPTRDATLPTTLDARWLQDGVPFASTPQRADAVTAGLLDERGYWILPSSSYRLGAASELDPAALLMLSLGERPATYSLYAIGEPGNESFPVRGLLCDESAQTTALTLPCSETDGLMQGPLPSADLDAGGSSAPATSDASATNTQDGGKLAAAAGMDAGSASPAGTAPGTTPGTTPGMVPATMTGTETSGGELDASAPVRPGADDAGSPAPSGSDVGLTAQYELNSAAPADIVIAPVLRIANVGVRAGVPLSSLKVRYYFTNEHYSECPDNCVIDAYYANLALGQTVDAREVYVPLGGKQAYLELSFPKETRTLALRDSVQVFQGFHTTTYLPFDQSDDYSYSAGQTSFSDWTKITLYKDDVLVWGTPPP